MDRDGRGADDRIEQAPWLRRGFAFDLPLTLFPNVLERLRGTPARLEERLRGLPPAVLLAKPDGAWSVQETAGHLVQTEALFAGRLDDFLAGVAVLRPAAHDPRAVADADFGARPLADILAAFRAARAGHVRRLEGLGAADVARTAHHPRLDRAVNVLDMMVFAAEHDDHHLARISALLPRG